MMVMKYAALGSFADLLRSRQSNDPISIDDRLEACTQVARGLLYMEENTIVHGSLCCKNLMAFQQKDGEITVKIADPGLVHLYNQLSLDHNINMKRLPWLAVELYDDMTKVTMETDLYAYGVLIWEIMSDAENPLDKPPLKNMSHDERKEYFKSGFTLGIPSLLELDKIQIDGQNLPEILTNVNRGKIKMRKTMEQCWDHFWTKRPRPKLLLRELYLVMQAYGVYSNYHSGSSGESSHYYYAQDDLPTDKNASHIHNARKEAQQDPEMYVQNEDFIAHPQMQNYSKISTIPIQHQEHNADWQPDEKEIHSPLSIQSLQENQLSDLQNSGQVALVEPNQCTSPVLFIQTQFRLLPAAVPQDGFTTVSGHFLSSHQVSSTERTKSAKKEMPFINANIVKINYEDKLGKGSFGSVYSGEIDGKLKVAIKLLERVPNVIQTSIKQEAMVMTGLSHENIVRFHGLCIKDNCLVMEYVAGGCLQTFLKKNEKNIPAQHLSRFCIEICQGMEYLYLEKIVHCDLATKNVLLTENSMNGTVKIADFGLARTLPKDKDYYRRKTETSMPLWSAPEYHHSQRFSFKADIWSCGTTFWEVYSFGRVPELRELNILFSAHTVNSFGKDQGQKLLYIYLSIMKTGERLPEPDDCPDWMYQVMLDCWKYDPDQRPDIMTLLTRLKRLKENPILMENISPLSSADTTSNKQSVHIPTSEISGAALSANDTEKKTSLSDKYIYRLSSLIIPDDIIQIQETIGEGNFGQVKRGILDGKTVAIKCLKTNLSGGDDAKRFLREIELLHKASHPNIVLLLGILRGHMDLFVMEYLENGNLRDYLISQKKKGTLPKQMELLKILKDISAGMEYLTSINILHGDLTASNILLTGDLQAKVSDFGLGKIFNEVPYQRSEKAKFHYKWCAPEVLKYRTFNKTSDVWSYGVLLWEVFTYGEEPNYGDSFSATSRNPQYRFTEKVLNDVKLPKPANCPNTVYQDIMIKCWAMKSENRPLFSHIKEKLMSDLKKMNE